MSRRETPSRIAALRGLPVESKKREVAFVATTVNYFTIVELRVEDEGMEVRPSPLS